MKQDKMHLINKLFNNETIRTVWDKSDEKYYISVVDVVGVLIDNEYQDSRNYWKVLKHRLKKEGNETVTNCNQLKLKAKDGKYRMTDVVDIEGMFRIIESVPSKNAEPIKQWLAKLGKERIDETFDPSITVQRAIDMYRAKGYDEDWIIKRIKGIQDRKKLTDVWNSNGVTEEVSKTATDKVIIPMLGKSHHGINLLVQLKKIMVVLTFILNYQEFLHQENLLHYNHFLMILSLKDLKNGN